MFASVDEIVYTCDDGYKLDSDSAIVCTYAGKFNKPIPMCVNLSSGCLCISYSFFSPTNKYGHFMLLSISLLWHCFPEQFELFMR